MPHCVWFFVTHSSFWREERFIRPQLSFNFRVANMVKHRCFPYLLLQYRGHLSLMLPNVRWANDKQANVKQNPILQSPQINMMGSVAYHFIWLHAFKGNGFIFLSTTRSSGDYCYKVAKRLERSYLGVILGLRHYSSVKPCSPFFSNCIRFISGSTWETLKLKKLIKYFDLLYKI